MKHHRPAVEVTDAAQMLASKEKPLSRSSVYRLVKAGELEAYQLGEGRNSKLWIIEESIDALLKRRATKPSYDRRRIRELLAS